MRNKRDRLSTKEDWDAYFEEGGPWEVNGGPEQSRLFAAAFCRHTRIQLESGQSLLDCGCALGDALPVFSKYFPKAQLHACDFSTVAIRRSKEQYVNLASFSVVSMEEVSGMYDMIYSSNTLEHFADYKEKARKLLQHCRYLCILVPYNEKRFGKDLEYDPHCHHVVTFCEHSFDFLIDEGHAKKVHPPKVFTVPKAWSWSLSDWIVQPLKNIVRPLLQRPIVRNNKQILFEIENRDY